MSALGRIVATGLLLTLPLTSGCASPATAPAASQPALAPATSRPAARVQITPTADPSAESKVELSESGGTLTGRNLRLVDLVCLVARTPDISRSRIPLLSSVRVISAVPLPEQRYDVLVRLSGAGAEELRAALRRRLESQFGLRIRNDWRQTDVLVLRPAPGRDSASRRSGPVGADRRLLTLNGSDFMLLAEQLEERLGRPVVNETDLRGPYELKLEEAPFGAGQPVALSAVQSALREQLGLELIPGRRVVEFLVVEQVAPALSGHDDRGG
jgi:uncharacterized protein (TIGR03435 family)